MKRIIALAILLICILTIKSEDLPISKIVPVSPNSASLGIYGTIPLGHYTGTPNVSVPIYELILDGKNFPINLSYNARGIKVSQEASNVGLGWTLNIGGCIIKEERGWDDFSYTGYYYNSYYPWRNSSSNVTPYYFYKNNEDTEPDLYYFNFGSYSGTMVFDQYNNDGNNSNSVTPLILNDPGNLDIKLTLGSSRKWVISDGDGYKYYFGTTEETANYSRAFSYYIDNKNIRRSMISVLREKEPYVITAWHLDSIVSPYRNKIIFNYLKERVMTPISVSEEVAHKYTNTTGAFYINDNFTNAPVCNYSYSYSTIEQVYMNSIEFDGGHIMFNTSDRFDIEPLFQDKPVKKLDNISIYNEEEKIKNVDFIHSYYGNMSEYLTCRLKLNKVKVDDQTYCFYYNTGELPNKNAY